MKLKKLTKIFCCLNLLGCVLSFYSASAIQLSDDSCSVAATEKLFESISKRDLDGIKSAMCEGADVNARSDRGTPLLHLTTNYRDYGDSMALVLLGSERLDVNAVDCFGNTALHGAIINDNEKVVRVLLMDPRTDVNIRGWKDRTPLVLALVKNKEKIAQLILGRNGVNVLDSCFGGCIALEIAQKKGYEDIARRINVMRWLQWNVLS